MSQLRILLDGPDVLNVVPPDVPFGEFYDPASSDLAVDSLDFCTSAHNAYVIVWSGEAGWTQAPPSCPS